MKPLHGHFPGPGEFLVQGDGDESPEENEDGDGDGGGENRGQDEVAKAHKYGIESFAEALLPVRDSLELALASDAPSIENLKEGVEATLRLLATVFEKNKLVAIDPAGQKFDPNLHQAISMVPGHSANPPAAANHVVAVLQKGYLINDRVLRPALVTVAQG